MNKNLVCKKEEIKCNIIKQYKHVKDDIKEHNPHWPESPEHPYRILIIEVSGSGKTNALLQGLTITIKSLCMIT